MPQSRNNVLRIRKRSLFAHGTFEPTAIWRLSKSHHKSKCEGCERDGAVPNMCSRLKVSQVYATRWATWQRFQGRSAEALRSYGCSGVRATCSSKNGETTVTSMVLSWFCKGFFSFFTLGCDAAICIAATEACRIYCTTGRYLELLKIWLQSILYLAVYVAFRKHCQPQ